MAARGARTATRTYAPYWHALGLQRERPTGPSAQCGLPAGAAAIGLDSRTERRDRLSLVCRQYGRCAQISLARPGGNATGFAAFDYGLGAKWLQLLKELAPNVTRAAVIRDPAIASGLGSWAAIQSASPATGIEVSPINMADAGEIEGAVAAFAQAPNGGLILTGSALAVQHRDLIIALAARHKLPAIYYDPYYVAAGGLASYGVDNIDQFRRAAGYVDRILKGEKPAEMPAQQPTKYELVINLKTAKAMGLTIPESFLQQAMRSYTVCAFLLVA
jgi:putative ABC transport system substrate-binding protein